MTEVYRHVIHHLVSWRFLPTAHSIHTSVRSRAIHLVLRKAINHLVPFHLLTMPRAPIS